MLVFSVSFFVFYLFVIQQCVVNYDSYKCAISFVVCYISPDDEDLVLETYPVL